jgi:hypothetical protein
VADTSRVFFPRSAPLTLTRDEIRGLRLSLNTPVVATEELPIGPARAAILVHEGGDAGPQVTIGIRSLRAQRVALYAFEGDLREASAFAVAVDAALSFAESMGFLFDEDELGAGGATARVRCLGLWRELLGEDALGGVAPAREGEPEPAEELLLEELAEDAALDRATDSPVFLGGDDVSAAGALGGATDVFVPQFEGDFGPSAEPSTFEAVGALAFDPDSDSVRVELAPGTALDDETSFAGVLDPSDDPDASDPSDAEQPVAQAPPAAPAKRAAPPLVSLTKFRGGLAGPPPAREPQPVQAAEPAAAPPASAAKRGKKALGKLRLIRRMRGGAAGGGRKRHPILRLFGSF